jgi:hypothetical protein
MVSSGVSLLIMNTAEWSPIQQDRAEGSQAEAGTVASRWQAPYWMRLGKAVALVLAGIAVQLWIDGPQPAVPADTTSTATSVAGAPGPASRTVSPHPALPVSNGRSAVAMTDPVSELARPVGTGGQRGARVAERAVERDRPVYQRVAAVSPLPARSVVRAGGLPDFGDGEVSGLPSAPLRGWPNDTTAPSTATVPQLAAPEPRRPAVSIDAPPPGAAAPVARVGRSVSAAPAPRDEESILEVLHEYETAVGRKDPLAAKAVWPALDDRALARAFNDLQSHSLALEDCGVTVTNSNAAARAKCQGVATSLPKVGRRKPISASHEWTFNLSKSGGDWQIESAAIR